MRASATLSVGERQRVEILKALYRDARILILDEPTSVLTPQEAAALFATLARLVAEGLSIIFISHKLDRGAARVRPHRRVARRQARRDARFGRRPIATQLAELMVGRSGAQAGARREHRRGDDGVRADPRIGRRRATAHACSTTFRWPCAPARSSASPACRATARRRSPNCCRGLRRADAGTVSVAGLPLPADPRAWIAAGVARIPADRHAVGVVGDFAVWENAIAERYRKPFASAGLLRRTRRANATRARSTDRFDVRGGGTRRAGARAVRRQHAEADPRPRADRRLCAGRRLRAGADRREPADVGPRRRRRRVRAPAAARRVARAAPPCC